MIYSASAVTAEHQYGRSYIFLLRQTAWLVIGYFVCGFHVAFVGGHLPAYVSDKGIGLSLFGITLLGRGTVGALASAPLRRLANVSDRALVNGVTIVGGALLLWTLLGLLHTALRADPLRTKRNV